MTKIELICKLSNCIGELLYIMECESYFHHGPATTGEPTVKSFDYYRRAYTLLQEAKNEVIKYREEEEEGG